MKNLIKKIFIGLMAYTSVIPLSVGAYYVGDINCDNNVNISDYAAIVQYLSGIKSTSSGTIAERLDLNRDYIIDVKDKNLLNSILLGTTSVTRTSSQNTTMTVYNSTKYYYKYNAQTGEKIDCGEDEGKYKLLALGNIAILNTQTMSIVGGVDDRFIDNSKSGVVRLKYYNESDHEYQDLATGFVVDSHTIMTCAHALYSRSTNSAVKEIRAYFYDNNGNEIASYDAVASHFPADYVSDGQSKNDYGLVTISENISSYCCFNLGISRNMLKTYKHPVISVTGYSDANPSGANSNLRQRMVTGNGELYSDITDELVRYTSDTVAGESGSPVYIVNSDNSATAIGIHTSGTSELNNGKRIDNNIMHFVFNNPNL